MQIVIDISEKQYEIIKELVKKQNSVCSEADSAEKIILKGMPLPKGHGRILDEKDILDTENNDGGWYDLVDMSEYIAGVKAIIEADKAESEDKKKLSWLGKNCKDCGNEKCKKLGTLPRGYDCALWQAESEENE